ncbi:hypothetical protein [Nocardioides ferulae]|uniref:hypothetical protein n=1 Tax=Nocardioides ferulae TaxID=2340821 RepID=UPI001F0B83E7|nr:hypothetical protein [Nocardioides ferulae]
MGELDDAGFRELTAADAVPTAVEVTARTSVDFSFTSGEGGAVRSAVAVPESVACFSVGAVTGSVTTSDSPILSLLNGIVGVDLTAISAAGVADIGSARIPLLQLALALGVGELDQLLDLEPITVGRLVLAMATVLERDSANTATVELLNGLATLPVGEVPLRLADILRIDPDAASALQLDVSALQLLTATLFVAGKAKTDGSEGTYANAIGVPSLTLAVPPAAPLIRLTARIGIIEPPTIACGRAAPETEAQSAQIRLYLRGDVLESAMDSLPGEIAGVALAVDLELGRATGQLTAIRCAPSGGVDEAEVNVQTALLHVDVDLAVTLPGLKPTAEVDHAAIGSTAARTVTLSWTDLQAPHSATVPVRAPLASLGLASLVPGLSTDLWVVDKLLLEPLTDLLIRPLLVGIDLVLTPTVNFLGSLLGLDLSGVDVRGEARPNCRFSTLRG